MKTLSIVGSGYVGLTTAAIFSNCGHRVYAVDVDEKKIETINNGKSHFFEPGLDDFVKKGVESGNLIATADYGKAIPESDIVFICVGTPSNDDGSVNLDYVFEAVKQVLRNAKQDLVLVQKSTVPVETGKRVERLIEKYNENKVRVDLLSVPEFLREGAAVFDTLFFDRIVIGGKSKTAVEEVVEVYRKVDEFARTINHGDFTQYAFLNINSKYIESLPRFDGRVVRTNLESAELIKVIANSFLAMKISFANTISRLCVKTGAECSKVMDGIGLDTRIGRAFLYAGIGYGGGCFPKDVAGMINTANAFDVDFGILDEVVKVNETQVYFAVNMVKKLLGDGLEDRKVAFLGLSFKPGTSDVRESPALRLLDKLLDQGMIARAYDPRAISEAREELEHPNLEYVDNMGDVFDDAELVVLATEWQEFINFDYSKIIGKMKSPNFFDGRGVLDMEKMKDAGFVVMAV